jgi:hypothetical protein
MLFFIKEKGMRKPKELPEGALESLAMGLKQAKTRAEF